MVLMALCPPLFWSVGVVAMQEVVEEIRMLCQKAVTVPGDDPFSVAVSHTTRATACW